MALDDIEKTGNKVETKFALDWHKAELADVQKEVTRTKRRAQLCFTVGGAGLVLGLVLLFPPNIKHPEWFSVDALVTGLALAFGLRYAGDYDEHAESKRNIEERLRRIQKQATAAQTMPR